MIGRFLAAAPPPPPHYTVTCGAIGNCTPNTMTISAGLTNIVHILIVLVGMLAVIFVIISGLQMALSAGNAKRFQQGREALLYSIVGVVLALVAYAVVSLVAGAF